MIAAGRSRLKGMLTEEIKKAREEEGLIFSRTFENEEVKETDARGAEFDTVVFTGCRFENCDFTGVSFVNVELKNCLFAGCKFQNGYWKNVKVSDCKAEGSIFSNAVFKWVSLKQSQLGYGNFSQTLWEFCEAEECSFQDAFLSEVRLKKTRFSKADFTGADFFMTSLKGLDLSDSILEHITVSDSYRELAGLKVNMFQAAELAKLMGIKIV